MKKKYWLHYMHEFTGFANTILSAFLVNKLNAVYCSIQSKCDGK